MSEHEFVDASFGELVKAAFDPSEKLEVAPDVMHRTDAGAYMKLPMQQFALDADDLGIAPVIEDRVNWLSAAGEPLLDAIPVYPVASKKGSLPFGSVLPTPSMQTEHTSSSADGALVVSNSDYDLTSVVEVKSVISLQTLLQADVDFVDAIETSHRTATAAQIVAQIMAGDGLLNNLTGILSRTGVTTTDYPVAERGDHKRFQDAEALIEDASGRPSLWMLGEALSNAARTVGLFPSGGDRATEERAIIQTTGTPVVRDTDLETSTGVVADWRQSCALVTSNEVEFIFNRISRPGDLLVTSRLGIDLLVLRPALIQGITEA